MVYRLKYEFVMKSFEATTFGYIAKANSLVNQLVHTVNLRNLVGSTHENIRNT